MTAVKIYFDFFLFHKFIIFSDYSAVSCIFGGKKEIFLFINDHKNALYGYSCVIF